MNLLLAHLVISILSQDMVFTDSRIDDFLNLTESFVHKELLTCAELQQWLDEVEKLKTNKEK